MPRVLARRAPPAAATAATTTTAPSPAEQLEEFEWVEWVDEPRHELLFDVLEPSDAAEETSTPKIAARAYAAVFPSGAERWTLFHRHREDTAYVCISGAADTEDAADVWNEVLRELSEEEEQPKKNAGGGGGGGGGPVVSPTHELLPAQRVIHATGQCFCNPHATRDKSAYIHRIRYAPTNPNTLHFVGVEVKRPTATAAAATAAAAAAAGEASPSPVVRPLFLTPEHEQPGLFRTWRLRLKKGDSSTSSSSSSAPLGGGFARRGGAVVLIKGVDWSKVAVGGEEGEGEQGPFGAAARAKARAAGGWSAAAAAAASSSSSSSSSVFPAGASWPLTPEDGRVDFSLAVEGDETILEAMLVEFL